MTTIILIAKEPLPGQAKTRLTPPLTVDQAAAIATACIADTAAALAAAPAARRILFFHGTRVPASVADFEVIAQPSGTLDERLAWVFDNLDEPVLLVGMDTPQLTPSHLAPALINWRDDIDAWFGPADDGGFWALGLREPHGGLVRGVPMSRPDTGAIQLARLEGAGLRVGLLDLLTDVDTIDDALAVAAEAPHTRFARELRGALAQPTAPESR